jgi:methyl-accepting chemotaxis protein
MFDNLKISGKLFVGFGVVLALLAFVSIFNITNADKINTQVDFVKDVRYRDALDTLDAIDRAGKILNTVVHASESATIAPVEEAREARAPLEEAFDALGKSLPTGSDASRQLVVFRGLFNTCFEVGERMTEYSVNQELIEFVEARGEYQQNFEQLEKAVLQLKEVVSLALYESLEEINRVSDRNVNWSSYLAIIGLILGIGLSLMIARSISSPMARLVEVIDALGRGELDSRVGITRGDEIGRVALAMDDMAKKLGQMVHRIRSSSSEFGEVSKAISEASVSVETSARLQEEGVESTSAAIQEIGASIDSVAENVDSLNVSASDSTSSALEMAASIEEVAENSQQLAQSVAEIGSSITEMATAINQVAGNAEVLKKTSDSTASTVAQMDANIKQVEEHARETASTTTEVSRDAEEGKISVEKTIAGIHQIKDSSRVTSEAVDVLAEKVKDIGSILAVIVEVAEQTNLLALNAAIISAQAGQHGKSFAVVADEIRELSQRTSNSTRKIESVIEDVQRETAKAVEALRETEASITEGEELSLKSGQMLGKIVSSAQGGAERMEHIVKATVEQAQASRSMRESVENVSEMVGQIASATKEQDLGARAITSAAELLGGLTEQLKNSTQEQSQTSRTIGQSMEKMSQLVQQVKVACDQQKVASGNIVHAVEDIKGSTRENVSSVGTMNGAVSRLTKEIAVLQEEMDAFKIETAD